MSLDIKLTNKNLITYSRTDDALEAFQRSADSGQTRLAIEVLAELVTGLIEEIEIIKEMLESKDEGTQAEVTAAVVEEKEEVVIESSVLSSASKPKAKPTKESDSDLTEIQDVASEK
jgi:hypothetical protein